MASYEALTEYLGSQPADESVSLTIPEIDELVGGLPPSSAGRTWWANTRGHSQSRAWMRAGRRVSEVRLLEAVVFSPADAAIAEESTITRPTMKKQAVLDGVSALSAFAERAGYASIVDAVAAHTIFLHPDTVAQTGGEPLFPVIRDPTRRGVVDSVADVVVMYDDNTTPTRAYLWSAQRSPGRDVQYNHLWGDPRNPSTYTALWNLAVTPAFLAKTTDGSNHPDVVAALRYRSYELFGYYPDGEAAPIRPSKYERLTWPEMPEAVSDLEAVLRARLADAPKSRPATAARELGWLYSNWMPDASITATHAPSERDIPHDTT